MKKVFFQGSFDLFHFGHLVALEKAKEIANNIGGKLIIGINTDELYKQYKQKEPVIPYEYRKKIIEALKCVDEVIPAPDFSPLKILQELDVDVYIICDEWKGTKVKEINYMKSKGGETIVLPYFPTLSTTQIRERLLKNYADHNLEICPKCHQKL